MKRNFKIRIFNDQKLSEAIQTKLFELGYHWSEENQVLTLSNLHWSYGLYADSFGVLTYASSDQNGRYFRAYPSPEIIVDELFQMEPEVRETVKIGGTTYDKEEFEQATKNLKPISL